MARMVMALIMAGFFNSFCCGLRGLFRISGGLFAMFFTPILQGKRRWWRDWIHDCGKFGTLARGTEGRCKKDAFSRRLALAPHGA